MNAGQLQAQAEAYRAELTGVVLPFWIQHGVDEERAGFFSCLDRDGALLDTDKSGWVQGRFTWLLVRAHRELGDQLDLLGVASLGVRFMREHGYCDDGRMWFQLSQGGAGLRKRRYAYTEFFASKAFAEWGYIAGDDEALREASRLFLLACDDMRGGRAPAKVEPVRQARSLGQPMITLGASHVLEDCGLEAVVRSEREAAVESLLGDFTHEPTGALLELVGRDEDLSSHLDGRLMNPGHAIEAAWFLIEEHRRRGDPEVLNFALCALDSAWDLGWDREHGGLLSLVDVTGAPVQELWAEMKLWWPHCEAILAFLYAYQATGDPLHFDRWRVVHEWAYSHFPDPEHGEWFGYLRRDGSVQNQAKGNLWKGPFHIPRMLMMGAKILDEMAEGLGE